MSVITTSAPSAATASAWARPCPRAPPVMKATRPSSCPMATPLSGDLPLHRRHAVGVDELRGHPCAARGGLTSVDEAPDEVWAIVELDHQHGVRDVRAQLGRERAVVHHEAPHRSRWGHVDPGGIATTALGAAAQRRPPQLLTRAAALHDEPALRGGLEERARQWIVGRRKSAHWPTL